MTLRKKTLLAAASAFLLAALLLYVATQSVVLGGFEQLERETVLTDVNRVEQALEESLVALQSFCGDWSGWDETRDFILGQDAGYIERNLQVDAFVNSRINFMAFLDVSGKVTHMECVDIRSEEKIAEVPGLDSITSTARLLTHQGPQDGKHGIMLLPQGAVLVAACPVTNNAFELPISGTLIVGRFLDEGELAALAQRTHLSISTFRCDDPRMPPEIRKLESQLTPDSPRLVKIDGRDWINGYSVIHDVAGKPLLILQVQESRAIYRHGLTTAGFFSALLLGGGLFAFLMFLGLLEWNVLRPLATLHGHVLRIRDSKDLTARLDVRTKDELGALAHAFNETTDSLRVAQVELDAAHHKLMEAARLAGMADVASGILHNVGNVLNSVNIATTTISRDLSKLKVDNLQRAVDMLEQHKEDLGAFLTEDERGSKLPAYLAGLAKHLKEEQASLGARTAELEGHVQHMAQIIALQQSIAKRIGIVEPCDLEEIVEEGIKINEVALGRHGIELERQFAKLPKINLDRHQVLQILVNLISNAKYALRDSDTNDKRICVGIERSNGNVRVTVADNGMGIDPPNLERVFAQGFTTRQDGHGFGLHTAAIAAKQLDGALTAHSEGLGKGAVFTLELPFREKIESR